MNTSFLLPVEIDEMNGITRLIRRICLLREQGAGEMADQLQTNELAAAIRDFRRGHPEALPDDVLQEMFIREEERMVEVTLLAESLIPQLRGS